MGKDAFHQGQGPELNPQDTRGEKPIPRVIPLISTDGPCRVYLQISKQMQFNLKRNLKKITNAHGF